MQARGVGEWVGNGVELGRPGGQEGNINRKGLNRKSTDEQEGHI